MFNQNAAVVPYMKIPSFIAQLKAAAHIKSPFVLQGDARGTPMNQPVVDKTSHAKASDVIRAENEKVTLVSEFMDF